MMKSTLILALALTVGATFSPIEAQNKKANKVKKEVKNKQAVTPVTKADSVSYALGVTMTKGLLPYLQSTQGVDTTLIEDISRGFEDGLSQKDNPKLKAYNAGMMISGQVQDRMLPDVSKDFEGSETPIDKDKFFLGFLDALNRRTNVFDTNQAEAYIKTARDRVIDAKNQKTLSDGQRFLDENAQKEGVVVLPSGLQYKVLREGNGAIAKENDMVTVKYEGRLIDGTEFDSSYKRNPQTTDFRPNQVIRGWTEALTMMPVGSKWELYIPQDLAYGSRAAGKIPAFSTLVFTVELEAVKAEQPNPKADEPKEEPVKPKIHPRKRG